MKQEKKGIYITIDRWINEDPAKKSFRHDIYTFVGVTITILLSILFVLLSSIGFLFYPVLTTILLISLFFIPTAVFLYSFTSFAIKEIKRKQ